MVTPAPGTGQLYPAPAVADGSTSGGTNGSAVAMRTRSRNRTGPSGQRAILDGQEGGCASISVGTRAETPRELDVVGGVEVPQGPDLRVLRFELPSDEKPKAEATEMLLTEART